MKKDNQIKPMLWRIVFLGIFFLVTVSGLAQGKELDSDQEAIKALIDSVYAGFTVKDGNLPDFQKIKSYFVDGAQMGSVRNGNPRIQSHEAYFNRMEEGLKSGGPSFLKEWEISGQTQLFGNVAQRISAYGVYVNSTETLAEKGVICFQLVKKEGVWKIQGMIWDVENETQKVPDFN